MAVNVTFSRISGGDAIADHLEGGESGINHGNISSGQSSLQKDIYIRHDGINEITDCKFYCSAFSGSYGGGASASEDFSEMALWGDSDASKGLLIDVDHDGIFEYNLKTGQMDSALNAVSLDDTGAGGTNSDDIGSGGEGNIKLKLAIPSNEDVPGVRQFDFIMMYSYTV